MQRDEIIRDFYGRVIGKITWHDNGDGTARDFYGRILGTYSKKLDLTRDFYGRVVMRGCGLSGLIWEEENKNHNVDVSKRK